MRLNSSSGGEVALSECRKQPRLPRALIAVNRQDGYDLRKRPGKGDLTLCDVQFRPVDGPALKRNALLFREFLDDIDRDTLQRPFARGRCENLSVPDQQHASAA